MIYLRSFDLPDEDDEYDFKRKCLRLDSQIYNTNNVYPFNIFPEKNLSHIEFAPVTVFYGGNGSGKSTLLNIIAEKLKIHREALFNNTPWIKNYLDFCEYLAYNQHGLIPGGSEIITSDAVFDFLLNIRSMNEGINTKRDQLLDDYKNTRESRFRMTSLDDYEELKHFNDACRKTSSQYVSDKFGVTEFPVHSNGESAYIYFTQKIKNDALYLLDEPENSLSAKLQGQLAKFLEDSARFYNCQFVIASHSPFILSIKGAKIYDLDSRPVSVRKWTELENVRAYYDFFKENDAEFD